MVCWMREVAVILPVHNEAWLIGSVLGQVTDFARNTPDWRFVFVDDGSSDNTPELISQHLQRKGGGDSIELVALSPNRGKAGAIREVMLSREEAFLIFTDGDLAYSLDHLPQLCDALETHDVAIGSRALADGPQTNITMARRLVGSGFNRLVRLITGLPYHDTQAGLKGFRRDAAHTLFKEQVVEDFAFDAELLYLAQKHGFTVAELPARVSARHSYKKSRVNMLRDPLKMLSSLVRMRLIHRGAHGNRDLRNEEKKTTDTPVSGLIEPKTSHITPRSRVRARQR
ncbi:MAG: hypothetical protein CBC35_06040 [Planctomycetes bacterium TMED75]|nr:glycosyl transferase [Planctomycetaceae bacterium]OUU93176.1 MAG: hypothetical protein CBC35_06040 [Planctomycetes bacterium TMED75]